MIICSSALEAEHIILCYHKFVEYGLNPSLLICQDIEQQLGPRIQNRLSKTPVDAMIIPRHAIEQNFMRFVGTIYMFAVFESFDLPIPHPFNHLKIESKRCILSIATSTGFPQVKTFNGIFTDELTREILSISSPTFITQWGDYPFLFKGGVAQSNGLTVKRLPFKVEAITGVSSRIRIMPCTNRTTPDHLIREWSRFCEGSNIELTTQTPDYYLVINSTQEQVDPLKTIYFMMEPYGENLYQGWIKQFKKILFYGCHKHHLNNVEWHLNYSTPQLKDSTLPDDRINGLCAIVSSRCADPGQRYRLELVRKLDEMDLPFPFHIYGQCADQHFKNYKGELPRISKEQALTKYKYNLICENNDIANYITEKMYDGILTETYTFYKGAPNVHFYFSTGSFGHLSGNLTADLEMIQQSIRDRVYESALPLVRKMKEKILTRLALPVRLNTLLELTDSVVVVRCANEFEVSDPYTEKVLNSQSFAYTGKVRMEEYESFLKNISSSALQVNRCAVGVWSSRVNDMLFQTLSNELYDLKTDMFENSDRSICYLRLRACEKIMLNQMNGQSLLQGVEVKVIEM